MTAKINKTSVKKASPQKYNNLNNIVVYLFVIFILETLLRCYRSNVCRWTDLKLRQQRIANPLDASVRLRDRVSRAFTLSWRTSGTLRQASGQTCGWARALAARKASNFVDCAEQQQQGRWWSSCSRIAINCVSNRMLGWMHVSQMRYGHNKPRIYRRYNQYA